MLTKRCRDYLDAAIELVRPGRTTAEIAAVWPKAQDSVSPTKRLLLRCNMVTVSASPFGRSQ